MSLTCVHVHRAGTKPVLRDVSTRGSRQSSRAAVRTHLAPTRCTWTAANVRSGQRKHGAPPRAIDVAWVVERVDMAIQNPRWDLQAVLGMPFEVLTMRACAESEPFLPDSAAPAKPVN